MARPPAAAVVSPQIKPLYTLIIGIVLLTVGVALCMFYPEPKNFQRGAIAIVTGLGVAGVVSAMPGFIEVKSKYVHAGGPLAAFVFICLLFLKGV